MLCSAWGISITDVVARNAALPDGRALQQMLDSSKPIQWVFLGDSVSLGMSCHLHGGRSYVDLWQELVRWELRRGGKNRHNDTVVNLAQSGETAELFLKREWNCMSTLRPQVVFIHYGINDARSGVSPAEYCRSLSLLVAKARSGRAIPVLIIPPLTREPVPQTRYFEEEVRKLAQKELVLLVDVADDWRLRQNGADTAPSAWMADDLHPNSIGHRLILRTMAQSLNIVPEFSEVLLLPTNQRESFFYHSHCLRRQISECFRSFRKSK